MSSRAKGTGPGKQKKKKEEEKKLPFSALNSKQYLSLCWLRSTQNYNSPRPPIPRNREEEIEGCYSSNVYLLIFLFRFFVSPSSSQITHSENVCFVAVEERKNHFLMNGIKYVVGEEKNGER
eukprot:TRINITY_DN3337_c6_g1_i1.p1 TRINITY_DN3337_c6_g1~~TRINITY_DN3337_c6_g1_i1.p1  ORF type:complete len:122 (-),score=9.70 TRINITY_DN3337_c6_g1_i1:177-542(-)